MAIYEIPYNVTGIIKHTGPENTSKDIYVKIEILERWKVRTQSDYTQRSGNKESQ